MRQTENNQVRRIIPLTKSETIDFYVTGKMPERFETTGKVKRDEILRKNGVDVTFTSTGE